MKKIYLILTIALCSCAVANQYSVGMSEGDFKRLNKNESLVGIKGANSVYLLPARNGNAAQYVYFRDGVLFQVDQGIPSPDLLIQTKQ